MLHVTNLEGNPYCMKRFGSICGILAQAIHWLTESSKARQVAFSDGGNSYNTQVSLNKGFLSGDNSRERVF